MPPLDFRSSLNETGLGPEVWALVEGFEEAWQQQPRPNMADFLPTDSEERMAALPHLAAIDLEYRLKTGEPVRLEHYLQLYPALSGRPDVLLALVRHEFAIRRRQEPGISVEEYVARFPALEPELHQQLAGSACQAGQPGPGSTLNDRSTRDSDSVQSPVLNVSESSTNVSVRYRPLRFHARGGLGEVYVADDTELHRRVALKRIRGDRAEVDEYRKRFLVEAEITARLEHPGVVPVHGLVHDQGGQPCYAMRFIEGESLAYAIERYHGRDPSQGDPGDRIVLFRQLLNRFISVCNTIAYAHSRGIIHRDLKPANIMLGKYGETLVVDWGLARKFQRDEASRAGGEESVTPETAGGLETTRLGDVKGTVAYMSPEQAMGRWNAVGPASDLFALGATLYAILVGKAPYEGPSSLDLAQRCAFERPRALNKEVPPALEAIALKAMATAPESRYPAALELAADVEHWLADEPVIAYREPLKLRVGRRVKRHRTAVIAATALLATVAVAMAIIAFLAEQGRQRSLDEQARTEQERSRAHANLTRALRSVDQMLTRVGDERLANLPQFDEERRQILQDALQLYRELLDQNNSEPEAQLETGKAHTRVGDINVQLGKEREAIFAYEEATRLLEALSKVHPDVAEYTVALAQALDQHGLLLSDSEEVPTAASAFERAIQLWQHLLQIQPAQRDYQSQLAMDYYRLANMLSRAGQVEQGEESFLKAVALQTKLAGGGTVDSKAQATLGSIYNSFAAHYLRTKRWAKTYESAKQALPLFETLHAAYPNTILYQYELSYSWNCVGIGDFYFDRRGDAETAYKKATANLQNVLDNHPHLIDYRSEMADDFRDWGDVYREKGWLVRAEREYRKALAWRKELVEMRPDNVGYARSLSQAEHRLGSLETQLRHWSEAHEALNVAEAVLTRLAQTHPATALDRFALAEIHLGQGDLLRVEGKSTTARERYRFAATLLEAAPGQESDETAARPLRSRLHLGLALLEMRLRQPARADREWQRALAMADRTEQIAFRAVRARELVYSGSYAVAVAEAEALAREPNLPTPIRADLARVWSLASGAAALDSQLATAVRSQRTEAYALQALALLNQLWSGDLARDSDEGRQLLADPGFDGLRVRADFRELQSQTTATRKAIAK